MQVFPNFLFSFLLFFSTYLLSNLDTEYIYLSVINFLNNIFCIFPLLQTFFPSTTLYRHGRGRTEDTGSNPRTGMAATSLPAAGADIRPARTVLRASGQRILWATPQAILLISHPFGCRETKLLLTSGGCGTTARCRAETRQSRQPSCTSRLIPITLPSTAHRQRKHCGVKARTSNEMWGEEKKEIKNNR